MARIQEAIEASFGGDSRIRVLQVQEFPAGSPLIASADEKPQGHGQAISNSVTLVKFFLRTTGQAPETPCPDAGTDVGMEIWLPDPTAWNSRVRCQLQGAFMGDFRVTSTRHFSLPVCTVLSSGEIASELGYVVSTTDGGHASVDMENFSYLMKADGSINDEGWKNLAYEATHLLSVATKRLTETFYGRPAKKSYLYGCSSGGRAAYHAAQKYSDDFDGLLIGAPSLTQSLMFISLLHPIIVVNNDLGGVPFKPQQLEMISQKAIATGDQVVNGKHDGYLSDWEANTYDPTKDPSVLSETDGGKCTEPWALSMAQAQAMNKIWYGPTLDGSVPSPNLDNGATCPLRPNQLFWGKNRGTVIDYTTFARPAATGLLALALQNANLASPNWTHPTGTGRDEWRSWSYSEYADAMRISRGMDERFAGVDADDPTKLCAFQNTGGKILTYHGMADPVTNPQISINYYRDSARYTGGLEKTRDFHRLFVIPGMGHCIRASGCAGKANPPIPTLEELFAALVDWTESDKAPERLVARSVDEKVSRPIYSYKGQPGWPVYKEGDVHDASSYE